MTRNGHVKSLQEPERKTKRYHQASWKTPNDQSSSWTYRASSANLFHQQAQREKRLRLLMQRQPHHNLQQRQMTAHQLDAHRPQFVIRHLISMSHCISHQHNESDSDLTALLADCKDLANATSCRGATRLPYLWLRPRHR